MTEANLYPQLAMHLDLYYPSISYHFDSGGMWTPSHKARNLYGKLNKRGFPDLVIFHQVVKDNILFSGLALEIKAAGTRLVKRDGGWASSHIEDQAEWLERLRDAGFVAQFVCGYDEAIEAIDSFLVDVKVSKGVVF